MLAVVVRQPRAKQEREARSYSGSRNEQRVAGAAAAGSAHHLDQSVGADYYAHLSCVIIIKVSIYRAGGRPAGPAGGGRVFLCTHRLSLYILLPSFTSLYCPEFFINDD